MNKLIAKRAALFSLILGAILGLVALIPAFIGLCLFILTFIVSPVVIIYMKKDEKHLAYLTNEQGATLGAIIGFFATVGFFASFSPMICILRLVFHLSYTYAIYDMVRTALWLFFVIVFMVGAIFAMTNAASGMGIAWIYGHLEEKPKDYDARLDIKIED